MDISNDEFDEYVCRAIEEIDPQFRRHLDEVPVIVDELPEKSLCRSMGLADRRSLLGVFRGLPINRRSSHNPAAPSQIILYRENLLRMCRCPSELSGQIRKTILHELGHYLGFSEAQIRHYLE